MVVFWITLVYLLIVNFLFSLLINPFYIFRVGILNWDYNDILYGVVVATGVIGVDVLDYGGDLGARNGYLNTDSVRIGGQFAKLQVRSVNAKLFELSIRAEAGM